MEAGSMNFVWSRLKVFCLQNCFLAETLTLLVFTPQLMQTKQDTRRQDLREDKTDQFTMQRAEINPFSLISAQDDVHQDTSDRQRGYQSNGKWK